MCFSCGKMIKRRTWEEIKFHISPNPEWWQTIIPINSQVSWSSNVVHKVIESSGEHEASFQLTGTKDILNKNQFTKKNNNRRSRRGRFHVGSSGRENKNVLRRRGKIVARCCWGQTRTDESFYVVAIAVVEDTLALAMDRAVMMNSSSVYSRETLWERELVDDNIKNNYGMVPKVPYILRKFNNPLGEKNNKNYVLVRSNIHYTIKSNTSLG